MRLKDIEDIMETIAATPNCDFPTALMIINNAPTITPESLVRHGRWIEGKGEDIGIHFCSNPDCRKQAFNYEDGREAIEVLSDYCPHCGAVMDLEE